MPGDDHTCPPARRGRASRPRHDRRRRGSRDCSAAGASAVSSAALHEPVCPKRVDRVLRAARVVLAGAGGRQQAERPAPRVDEADAEIAWHLTPQPCRVRRRTCSTSQPWPRVSRGLGEAGPRRRARSRGRGRRRRRARARSRAAAASAGSARRRSRPPSARRARAAAPPRGRPPGGTSAASGTGSRRPTLPVDGVEVPRAGQAVPALHERAAAQAESRFRPLARRRLRIARPARVDMRARKPCLRFRRRTLGW